jgi:hypothetical protein
MSLLYPSKSHLLVYVVIQMRAEHARDKAGHREPTEDSS